MANLPEREVYAKTVYAEARGEPREGQEWVAWVIKNRARMNKANWGGNPIKAVCLHPNQFSCWNGKDDIVTTERPLYERIKELTDEIYDAMDSADPTGGADHYINPDLCNPSWTKNLIKLRKIGNHQFYKSK